MLLISASITSRPYRIGGSTPIVPKPVGTFFKFSSRMRLAVLVRAHDLDQIMLGHGVARLAAENVFQTRLGAAFVAQADEIVFGSEMRQRANVST